MESITATDFLNAHKIHDNVFVTGMYYSGITIYNQQVRTLNLIYYLIEQGIVPKIIQSNEVPRIVIIGGGVSGLTAAIAFKRLNYEVSLLEEKSLLLHLQHGCSTRQIHPNLFMWPKQDSLKPFTELPFANWEASDAATVEKTLIKQFKSEKLKKGGGSISDFYDVKNVKVKLFSNTVFFENQSKKVKSAVFSFLLLATGFGLEKYVGRREKTKSYWRNEDLAQLRLGDQIRKFFISGVGDGGLSDIFRLSLIAFDPLEWAKIFEKIETKDKKTKLITELRELEKDSGISPTYNYAIGFERIYSIFKHQIDFYLNNYRRSDIDSLILNGREPFFEDNLVHGRMSFINAWLAFLLNKKKLFSYHSGEFPSNCGAYFFSYKNADEYHVIVRHGTDKNIDHFKKLHNSFAGKSLELASLQQLKKYNYFSTEAHWNLNFWTKLKNDYSSLKYIVSNKLVDYSNIFLSTIEGIISNFIALKLNKQVDFRVTLHRLVYYSNKYFFQQIGEYTGTRVGDIEDVGRAFPIEQGIVGLSMRTGVPYYIIRKNDKNGELFNYASIFARPLSEGIDGFLSIPVRFFNTRGSALCLYLDTKEANLVENNEFRQLIYWSLSKFISKIDSLNVSEVEYLGFRYNDIDYNADIEKLNGDIIPGLNPLLEEINPLFVKDLLRMSSNRLIDIYDK